MCGRFALPDETVVARNIPVNTWHWHWPCPRFNVAPTTRVPAVMMGEEGILELNGTRWGLIPYWWKKDVPPSLTFNARSEEAAEKPTWRHSLRGQRCLMPARGWYEWNENELVRNEAGRKVKQPYFISLPDADFMAFAGLWAVWQGQDGSQVLSCALMSKTAAPSIAHIHDRMPVVLKPDHFAAWLDPNTRGPAVQEIIADSQSDFGSYPVSTRVNNTRNDSPELLEPAASMFSPNYSITH